LFSIFRETDINVDWDFGTVQKIIPESESQEPSFETTATTTTQESIPTDEVSTNEASTKDDSQVLPDYFTTVKFQTAREVQQEESTKNNIVYKSSVTVQSARVFEDVLEPILLRLQKGASNQYANQAIISLKNAFARIEREDPTFSRRFVQQIVDKFVNK